MSKTVFEEVDYADEFQEFINQNADVLISEKLKQAILTAKKTELLKVEKSIGSQITIESVEVLDEQAFLDSF